MIVVGFEDSEAGQRRIVVDDLVGGVVGSDGDGAGGGARGMRVVAQWGWWPREGVEDELAFPKRAEIRECEDINGEWYTGVYCGDHGLFPSAYVRFCEGYGIRS